MDDNAREERTIERMNGRVGETTDATGQRDIKDNARKVARDVNGLIPVKFEGIGPTEEKTGCPIATRVVSSHK